MENPWKVLLLLWLGIWATLTTSSPLPVQGSGGNIVPEIHDGTDPNAISSGILRFGIEIETVLAIHPTKSHPSLRKFLEIATKYKGRNKIDIKTIHSRLVFNVRQFLVEEWKRYEPTKEQIKNNDWLKKAYDIMKRNEDAKRHTFAKPEMHDRWPDTQGAKEPMAEIYKTWSMTEDKTVKGDIDKFEIPIEFVSPILAIGTSDHWYLVGRYQVELFWSFIFGHCGFDIVKTTTSSTHVHVSPMSSPDHPDGWTAERVRRMASASVFFEPAIRSLIPTDRWANKYADEYRNPANKAHWNTPGFADPTVPDTKKASLRLIQKIEKIPTGKEVHLFMNPSRGPSSRNSEAGIPRAHSRHWGWNFSNIKDAGVKGTYQGKGSVEFRRGGQSMTVDDAMMYIETTVAFTLAACAHGTSRELKRYFDFRTLSFRKFIYHDWPMHEENSIAGHTKAYQRDFSFPELEKKFMAFSESFDHSKIRIYYDDPSQNQPVDFAQGPSVGEALLEQAFSDSDSGYLTDDDWSSSSSNSEDEEPFWVTVGGKQFRVSKEGVPVHIPGAGEQGRDSDGEGLTSTTPGAEGEGAKSNVNGWWVR